VPSARKIKLEKSAFTYIKQQIILTFIQHLPRGAVQRKVDNCQLLGPFISAMIIGPGENAPAAALADKQRK
jgi:hypothetical protein